MNRLWKNFSSSPNYSFVSTSTFRKTPNISLQTKWTNASFHSNTLLLSRFVHNQAPTVPQPVKNKYYPKKGRNYPKKAWKPVQEQARDLKQCFAFGTANSYDIGKLRQHFLSQKENIWEFENSNILCRLKDNSAVFYFDGSMVCWGTTPLENARLLLEIKSFEKEASPVVDEESIEYLEEEHESDNNSSNFFKFLKEDIIYVNFPDKEETLKHKLAYSYAIHTSLLVSKIEGLYESQISYLKEIPDMLNRNIYEKIIYKDRQKAKASIGELIKLRTELNLHNELLDVPDLFWEEPQMEASFRHISLHFEIPKRIRILNQRIDYCSECVGILRTQLHDEYSTRLEIMIIALISLEVIHVFFF